MSRHIQGFLILLLLFAIFGCGSGATSGDPLGTDSISVAASATSVSAGQKSVITATVARLDKSPATDRSVTFSFHTNHSGGTLSVETVKVDGQSKALAVYTAGSDSLYYDVTDTIQVRLSNDAVAFVVITRTAVTPFSIEIKAEPASLSAGQVSVITATVTSTSGSTSIPAAGVTVTFALPVNKSGATLSASSAITDGTGKAMVIYQPGGNNPMIDVQDTAQASLANGSIRAVVITRTAGIAPTVAVVAIEAAPKTLTANQSSVITATVTDNKGKPLSGETVIFSIPVRNTGSPQLTNYSGVSDGNGIVTTVYSPGTLLPANTVDDTVQASLVNGSSRAVVITRSGGTPISISVAAAPTSVNAGQASIVTATLTGDNNVGVAVKFSLPIYPSGATLSASSAITDGSGKAVVTYRAGLNDPTLTVSDVVQAAVGSISSSVVITRTTGGGTGGADSISSLIASKTEVSSGVMSVITATVRCERAASGESVSQTISFTIPLNKSEASFIDSSGASVSTITKTMQLGVLSTEISVTYSAGNKDSYKQVEDIVQATLGNGSTQSIIITRTGSTTGGYTISLTANPTTLASRTGTSAITATVKDSSGNNASGMPVHFSNTGSGTLDTMDRTTNTGGLATVTFTSTATAAGTAIVSACVDLDRSGFCAASEPNAAVVVTIP